MQVQNIVQPNIQPNIQSILPQKMWGLKAHKLIFTSANIEDSDIRQFIEKVLIEKFGRRPGINSVTKLNTREQLTTIGQQQQSKILVTFNSVWDV